MKILSQRDPTWSNVKLGASPLTIGRYGCTTTGLSMLSDYFYCYMRPDQIAAQTNWYTPQGLVIWGNLDFKHMEFVKRGFGWKTNEIEAAIKSPDMAILLEVNNAHWVVALSKALLGAYRIADPFFGDKSTTKRYGNAITGYAIFKIK
jgi:ABC-type bacteriocin/lantibiotic exporter with double-glycine peptidase domain